MNRSRIATIIGRECVSRRGAVNGEGNVLWCTSTSFEIEVMVRVYGFMNDNFLAQGGLIHGIDEVR
jgi:hypothetical protein